MSNWKHSDCPIKKLKHHWAGNWESLEGFAQGVTGWDLDFIKTILKVRTHGRE